MSQPFSIHRATQQDVADVTELVGGLLGDIMSAIGTAAFNFNAQDTAARLADFIAQEKYFVFVGRDPAGRAIGCISLYESYALYAEGAFGTIPELYVRPECRSAALGAQLLAQAKQFGTTRGWTRLEVTTPPLPAFERTLAFYEREGFAITGGRKLKIAL